MKAVLFDLDNTLYPEIEFVKSGFTVVARYLARRHHLDEGFLFRQMLDILQRDGRSKVFDKLLHIMGFYAEETVKVLVYLYRTQQPTIHLYDDVLRTLEYLRKKGMQLGIITDWMPTVQRNKIAALGLSELFDLIVCTDDLGQDCRKPSSVPYKVALELLGVDPSEAAYIGDDPYKDFLGANRLGMVTVQVGRHMPQNSKVIAGGNFETARFVITELSDVPRVLFGGQV